MTEQEQLRWQGSGGGGDNAKTNKHKSRNGKEAKAARPRFQSPATQDCPTKVLVSNNHRHPVPHSRSPIVCIHRPIESKDGVHQNKQNDFIHLQRPHWMRREQPNTQVPPHIHAILCCLVRVDVEEHVGDIQGKRYRTCRDRGTVSWLLISSFVNFKEWHQKVLRV